MFKKTFPRWLTHRYQLVIRNEEDLAEKSSMSFNHAKLITLVSIIFLLLFGLGLVLSHTLLARWLNPAYLEQENKRKLLQLSSAIENLDEQTAQQAKFIKLIQGIVAGKEEPVYELEEAGQAQDSVTHAFHQNDAHQAAALAEADAYLRSEFEEKESTLLATSYTAEHDLQALFFFTPIEGIITMPFNPQVEHYGVDVVAKENEPIKCIADGVVIFASWDVEMGWVIAVQHSQNLVSIYKHNAALLKKTGNFIQVGEVIAIMGNSGELSAGPHLHFEIWHKGNAVNPEHFITF